MANFNIVRKGYDTKQVDLYVSKLISLTDAKLLEHKNRIDELKEENRILTEKVEEYKRQEITVSDTLIHATKKANEIMTASKMRYALESERIKLFRAKWTAYVESALDKVQKLDESLNMTAYLTKMDDELRESIGNELNIKKARLLNEAEDQFMSERERLNTETVRAVEEKKEEKPKGRLKKETNADKTNEKFIGKVKESLKNNIRKEIRDYETQEEETQELTEAENTNIDYEYIEENALDNPLDGRPFTDLLKDLGLMVDT